MKEKEKLEEKIKNVGRRRNIIITIDESYTERLF
jgi:hypothetical protein